MKGVQYVDIKTPCGDYKGLRSPAYDTMCGVSIVRSGCILLESLRQIAPGMSVGKILIQRDETDPEKKPILFYSKLPANVADKNIIICDPMLGTGG